MHNKRVEKTTHISKLDRTLEMTTNQRHISQIKVLVTQKNKIITVEDRNKNVTNWAKPERNCTSQSKVKIWQGHCKNLFLLCKDHFEKEEEWKAVNPCSFYRAVFWCNRWPKSIRECNSKLGFTKTKKNVNRWYHSWLSPTMFSICRWTTGEHYEGSKLRSQHRRLYVHLVFLPVDERSEPNSETLIFSTQQRR